MKTIDRNNQLVKSKVLMNRRVFISVPVTGLLRVEWVMARYGQTIPCNWSNTEYTQFIDTFSPQDFLVADARNVAVKAFVEGGWEWLFFIDHDVVMPNDTYVKWNYRMLKVTKIGEGDPVFGGLYFTKSIPSEPLMYREWGSSFYTDWKLGDEVRVKGMGNGCNVFHRSVIKAAWDESEEYEFGGHVLRKVFDTPSETFLDPESGMWSKAGGTEDITFYNRLIVDGLLEKAGWKKHQKMPYPYLCDTSVFCRHVDWNGVLYPANGEEQMFVRKGKKR